VKCRASVNEGAGALFIWTSSLWRSHELAWALKCIVMAWMQSVLSGIPHLEIHDGAVVDLILERRPPASSPGGTGSTAWLEVAGVVLTSGERIRCR
jgi:hypothetical protein